MKKKILLIWQYARKDWIEVFENLSSDFDFVFCAEVFPESSTENVAHFANVIYWSGYKNAQEMLADVEPYKIVFMGLESLHTAALNYAAQRKGIETLYLQHGMYAPLEFYLKNQEVTNKLNPNNSLAKNKRHGIFMLKFYLSTFKFHIKAFSYLGKYIYYKNKLTQTQFLVNTKFEYRIADKYVVFTKENAKYLSERDGFNKDRYEEIGSPSFDKFINSENSNAAYILLIDTPLVEIIVGGKKEKRDFSVEEVNKFYKEINEFAKTNLLKLYIKLHPFNYKSHFYLKDENITYFKNCDIVDLLSNASQIVSFSSTLLLPAILKKNFFLVRSSSNQSLLNDLEKYGMNPFPYFNNLKKEDIKFYNLNNNNSVKEQLLKEYLYRVDGKATQRLSNILSN
ncbi:MAG: hypothetical protein Q8O88_01720 [bacterium]|nr:hypothetical protein [bacterium]